MLRQVEAAQLGVQRDAIVEQTIDEPETATRSRPRGMSGLHEHQQERRAIVSEVFLRQVARSSSLLLRHSRE